MDLDHVEEYFVMTTWTLPIKSCWGDWKDVWNALCKDPRVLIFSAFLLFGFMVHVVVKLEIGNNLKPEIDNFNAVLETCKCDLAKARQDNALLTIVYWLIPIVSLISVGSFIVVKNLFTN